MQTQRRLISSFTETINDNPIRRLYKPTISFRIRHVRGVGGKLVCAALGGLPIEETSFMKPIS